MDGADDLAGRGAVAKRIMGSGHAVVRFLIRQRPLYFCLNRFTLRTNAF